jgi:hypothetical protein
LLEIVGAEDTIRLGGLSDSPKQFWIDVHPKQVPVNRLPLSGFCPQPEIIFVRLNQRVWLAERVARVAAPAVIGRTLPDVGTNGVELNVPVTGEEIPVTLHHASGQGRGDAVRFWADWHWLSRRISPDRFCGVRDLRDVRLAAWLGRKAQPREGVLRGNHRLDTVRHAH